MIDPQLKESLNTIRRDFTDKILPRECLGEETVLSSTDGSKGDEGLDHRLPQPNDDLSDWGTLPVPTSSEPVTTPQASIMTEKSRERTIEYYPQPKFERSQLQLHVPLGVEMEFCPWRLASSYHERYIGRANKPVVSPGSGLG